MPPLALLLTLSSLLFTIGLFAVLTRRNAILALAGVELMINSANLNFIAFWRYGPPDASATGPIFILFSIALAAAEAAVGLAIIMLVFRHQRHTELTRLHSLHG